MRYIKRNQDDFVVVGDNSNPGDQEENFVRRIAYMGRAKQENYP